MSLILELVGLWLLASVLAVLAIHAAKSAVAHRGQP